MLEPPIQFTFSEDFTKEYQDLPQNIKSGVLEALKKIKENPRAKSLRLHRLSAIKPPVWKIDVFADRSWQISMRIQGSECALLPVATHKVMDRTY